MISKASIRKVCEDYPFLLPRDIDGSIDENFEYDSLRLEIPNGWIRLFLQMCSDIKLILKREGVLDDFYFIQVKEKYGRMRCYSNGVASHRVEEIISKYEYMSEYVCTYCGRIATCKTKAYGVPICNDCWKDYWRHEPVDWINPTKLYFEISSSTEGVHFDTKYISFANEWYRYALDIGIPYVANKGG